jgi:hypothetical protein
MAEARSPSPFRMEQTPTGRRFSFHVRAENVDCC